jgi:hypothetical protein
MKGEHMKELSTLLLIDSLSNIHRNEAYIPMLNRHFSVVYSALGNKDKAFEYLQKYQTAFEEQVKSEEKLELQRMHTREAINRQQDQINLLEQEAALKQSHIYIILLISVVVILTIVAFLIFISTRMRIKKIENRELQNSLDNEMKIAQINKENFENDLEQKNREISSTVLLVANKNTILTQLSGITRKYDDEGYLPNAYVRKMNEVIDQSLKSDNEWDKLKMHFDRVHPHFFTKLKELSNELTENDLRLCAYIRIGMRAKEIATMLVVHPDSINSNRYRLRKKLNLQRIDSLDDFIRNI